MIVVELQGDVELLREARDTLKRIENAALDEFESRGLLHMIASQARDTITKLEERLLQE